MLPAEHIQGLKDHKVQKGQNKGSKPSYGPWPKWLGPKLYIKNIVLAPTRNHHLAHVQTVTEVMDLKP